MHFICLSLILSATSYPWHHTWWFFGLLILLFIAILWFHIWRRVLIYRNDNRKQLDLMREEYRLQAGDLQAQMRPHFIFNALNSLQSYILNNDVDKAVFYLSVLSKLIRKTMDNSTRELIPLAEELELLRYFIEIEKMRFEGMFSYELILDENLPLETLLVPPMLLQPFAEKAIRQGIANREKKGLLQVYLKRCGFDRIQCIISDDGPGWEQKLYESHSTSDPDARGIQIIEDRHNILNEIYKTDAYRFEVTDTRNDLGIVTGTRTEVDYLYMEA
jgi:LytS/YehU family sensor histidine kinase